MDDSMSTHKTNSKNAKNSKKKRSAALLAAGVIGLATAGGAYAYWTSLGDGTGTASTGLAPTASSRSRATSPTRCSPATPRRR